MANTQKGFTLVETLIALSIFAILAASSASILNLALKTGDANEAVSSSMSAVTRARAIMRDDFLQMVHRPVRDPFGTQTDVTFEGGFLRDRVTIARFSRRGRINPGGRRPRGGIEHVHYLYQDGALIRRSYPQIDPTPETQPFDQVLLTNIAKIDTRFLRNGVWNLVFEANTVSNRALPVAVELVMTKEGGDTIRFVLLAPGERIA